MSFLIVSLFGGSVHAASCFSDTFTNANVALTSYDGWTFSGLAGTSASTSTNIAISSNQVKLTGTTGSSIVREAGHAIGCGDPVGILWVKIQAKKGGTSNVTTPPQLWSVYYDDAAGNNIARWYGSGVTARGRIGQSSTVTVTTPNLTSTSLYDLLDVKIDFNADTSEFFFNNVSIGVLSHAGAGNSVARVRFERHIGTTTTDTVFLDNLTTDLVTTDVLPPAPVTDLTAAPSSTQIALSWTNPASDYAGTMIRYRTNTFPSGPTDGTLLADRFGTAGQPDSITHTGLTNGTTYYYAVFTHDFVPNYSVPATASAIPATDTTPPGPVTNFVATGGSQQNTLTWTNPPGDFTGTMIRYRTNTFPTSPTDGTLVINKAGTAGQADSHTHTGLAIGTTYYYTAFAHDAIPNYATGATASGTTTPDTDPPSPTTYFFATAGNGQTSMSWVNPPSDFAGTMIRFRNDAFPTGPTDGTLVVDKAGTAGQTNYHTHTGLTNGLTYYYAAFSHDSIPNYATPATVSATPASPPIIAGAGPGVPNLTYTSGQAFTILSSIGAPDVPDFHGMAVMHNGWLVIQYSAGVNNGGHAFFDISNPFQPQLVHKSFDFGVREGHTIGFSNSYPGMYACTLSSYGIQFWDWTDIMQPVLLSTKNLPNIEPSDYDNGTWWLFWQAPYVFVGGSSKGLYVVDATDPTNTVLVKQMSTDQTGGFRVGSLYAVGNLLVTSANDGSGIATFDISNPVNPILLATNYDAVQYSTIVNGDKIFLAMTGGAYGFGMAGYDISNPSQINYIRHASFGDRGGYLTFQDGYVHVGASGQGFKKINVTNPASYPIVGTGDFTEPAADLDFASVMGNLTVCSDDDNFGTRIMPHQTAPDTTPPAVNMINPKPNATNQALTSRVGLTFTDRIDLRSVNSSTFSVRPMGGSVLPGKYSEQTGIVNFSPNIPLLANTTYEVIVPVGGIKDYVGNPVATTYTSYFSTGSQIVNYACYLTQNPPALINQTVNFNVQSCDDPGPFTYSWNFGDGTAATPFSATSSASHSFSVPGHFMVIVTVAKGALQSAFNTKQTITNPTTPASPAQSSTIALDASRQRIWNVNADTNTVTCIDAVAMTKMFEPAVGLHPRNLAVAPDGNIWVTNEDSATISVLNGDNGALVATIPMAYASRPYGIAFSPTGNAAYVTLMGSGYLLKIDPVTRNIIGTVLVGLAPKGIAITHDGARILVSRFISPVDHGEVIEVSGTTFTVTRTFQLAIDPGPDSGATGRGVPNYVFAATIAPDGQRAWVPSKKDNTGRGQFIDGLALTFETTVRTILSKLNLTSNTEDFAARRDLDNRSLAAAIAFTPIGDYAFVATLGSATVDIVDAYTSQNASSISDVGIAPDGLVLSTNGQRLFVHNFMSRQVAVYDVTEAGKTNVFPELARINAVQTELLSAQVLQGKQIFYNASDRKMSRDKYISCAACHFDGDSDGRVWDFTDRGEGLRNTTALTGRAGMRQGPVHWSGNFDEIQDFEHDIRGGFSGTGFMTDIDFQVLSRDQPLGTPKAGVSADLDALAAYVGSLKRVPPSPFRNSDGTMTADGIAGQKLFYSAGTGCASCHRGPQNSDSELLGNPNFLMHDVGTLTASSGQRLGAPLLGLDTPTLKGVWETWPYLHNGSAATLMDVITTNNPSNQHGQTSQLTTTEKQQLVSYLLQLDNIARSDYETDGDVDQADFGFLQRCLSTIPILPDQGCAWADLNYDGSVTQSDYTLFQNCVTGPEIPANLNCAE